MKNKICGIYKFTNKYDRRVYIGQAVDVIRRYKAHKGEALKNKDNNKNYFHSAIRKYGFDAFDFDILIECPREYLNYWEIFYIKYYNSNDKKNGYNETEGGYSTVFSEDVLKRMSESAKKRGSNFPEGYHLSNEHKKKLSEAHKGKPPGNKGRHISEEQRKKHSEFMKGRVQSPETLRKKSESLKGKNKGKHRVYREDGTYYMSK